MNTTKHIFMFMFLFLFFSISPASEFKADQSILITSCGQSADVLMVKILAEKSDLKFSYSKLAQPDTLKGQASLILVAGGSTKGLGAAKIDKQQEIDRVQALIKAAREAKMKIITMHMGGKARRGKLSDEFNKLAAEEADCLIVVKSGNEDKFFSIIAKEKKIPIYLVDKIMDAGEVMKTIFLPNTK